MLIPLVPWLHAITGWQFYDTAHEARVIEFRVPVDFRAPERRWLPADARGRLIEFPSGRRKRKLA
jgi:hypothetical protein